MPSKPIRIPLAQPIQSRTASFGTDSFTQNLVWEQDGNELAVVKRPGLTSLYDITTLCSTLFSGVGLLGVFGVYPFHVGNGETIYLACVNLSQTNNFVAFALNAAPLTGITQNQVVISTTIANLAVQNFARYVNVPLNNGYPGDRYLVLDLPTTTNSVITYYKPYFIALVTTNSGVSYSFAISGPNSSSTVSTFPGKNIVYQDEYLFIEGVDAIFNSELLPTPTANFGFSTSIVAPTFLATAFLLVYGEKGPVTGLAKHLNYLCVFKTFSTEFFYDNGANTPGSPLANYVQARATIGCVNPDTVVTMQDTVMWVGQSTNKGKAVYMFNGLVPVPVSTLYIDKYLDADSCTSVGAVSYKYNGHTLYILTLRTSGVTLVYDIELKMWYRWSVYNGTSFDIFPAALQVEGPYLQAAQNYIMDIDTVAGHFIVYNLDKTVYQDRGLAMYCISVSGSEDYGTRQPKIFGRLDVVADVEPNATLDISHSDNDYTTYSTARTVDLSLERPVIFQGGRSRRRAYKIVHTANTPFRAIALELDIKAGS